MDKIEQLTGEGQHTVAILSNPVLTEFELVDTDSLPLAPDIEAAFQAREMAVVGCVALIDGKFRTALDVPLDDATVSVLAQAYVQHVVTKLTTPKGDSVNFLQRLFNMPDIREN